MATIQRINIIGSREGSRNRRRLKANQTGKKFRVGIKSNISTNRNNLISGVDRRSEERFSRNAETDLVCRLLLEKKKKMAEYLNTLVDDSDPDTDLTQIEHLLQTAEAIRKDAHPL